MRRARMRWAALATGLLAISVSACAGGAPAGTAAGPGAYDGTPVTIEFWGGKPTLKLLADEFNARGGPITVRFVEQAGNVELTKNLRNAIAAGGGPCVFDTITEDLNTLASDGILTDLTGVASGWRGEYSPAAWEAVQSGESTYAVPAASIPNFMLYHAPTFEQAGLAYPRTWEEFVDAGRVLKQRGVSIFNLAGEDYTTYVYLAWQAGAQWWQLDGDGWRVDVDSPQTQRAADIIQQLIDGEMVEKISYAEFAAMMQQYDAGAIAARQLSTWQTTSMQSKLTSGLGQWEPAPNPTFGTDPEANVSFTRAYAVPSTCQDTAAAAEFAHWASTDAEVLGLNADPANGNAWFPAVANPTPFIPLTVPTTLLGEHAAQWQPVVENAVATQKGDWTYGPNAQPAFDFLADLWGKAVAGQIRVADIAPQLEQWIVDDMRQAGLTVTT